MQLLQPLDQHAPRLARATTFGERAEFKSRKLGNCKKLFRENRPAQSWPSAWPRCRLVISRVLHEGPALTGSTPASQQSQRELRFLYSKSRFGRGYQIQQQQRCRRASPAFSLPSPITTFACTTSLRHSEWTFGRHASVSKQAACSAVRRSTNRSVAS